MQRINLKFNWRSALIVYMALLLSHLGWSQQSTQIKGKVTDKKGEPIPGISVSLPGSKIGTTSDLNGFYQVQVPALIGKLVFTNVGYIKKEVPLVSGQFIYDVTLEEDLLGLEEVVVVGYGTQRKADITGSVAIVDVAESKKYLTNDISQLLQGRSPGITVNSDGQPGASPNVRIRGVSTFGNAQPLYVVDGVPVGTSIRDFSPNDIESMQVLKDASAGAIYGSMAANGVVIITTKQGKKNTPLNIEYNGSYGVDKVWQRIPVLKRTDYQLIANEVRTNAGLPLIPGNDPSSPLFIDNVDTDWQKEGLKNGSRQNHNLNFMGGGENTTYNLSFDYLGNDGTFVGNGPSYDRYTARINTTARKGIFKVGQTFTYTHSHENTLTYNNTILTGSRPPLVIDLVEAIPTQMIYDPNNKGGFGGTESNIHDVISLNAIAINSLFENYTDVDRMFATAYGEIDLINKNGHSLRYKLNLGYDKTQARDYAFQPAFDLGYFFHSNISRLDDGQRTYTTGLVENTLNYEKKFGKHALTALIGQTYQYGSALVRSGHSEAFTEPYFPILDNGSNKTASGTIDENALSSYLGRITYNYDDKYLLTANIRRDGSSRFSPRNRFGYFPSIALGWKLTNEPFFKVSKDIVSDLKLRASYGKLGNQNIGDYLYMSYINPNIVYNFNGQKVFGGLQTSLVSPDIKWESKVTSNIGLDGILLNGLIDFTVEYYRNKTTDILVGVPIPGSTGSVNKAPTVNTGSLQNSGFEFMAAYNKTQGDFNFSIAANVSTIKNKVLALGDNNEPIYGAGSKTEIGGEVGQHFGYVTEGIFQSVEEVNAHAFQSAGTAPGDLKFKDLNGDHVINADDRAYLGSAIPGLNYGLNFTASYKKIDFTLFASGSSGFKINSRMYRDLMLTTDYINRHEDILERWTPTNTNTEIPRLVANDPNGNGRDSDRKGWLQDGTYLRINTVSLGYTLPDKLIKGVQRLRVYATAQNLYTFQSYKGYNPDFTAGVFEPGFDFGSFPKPRTLMLGVQVGF
ncbi:MULTISPECIES: SusC/RagA family TonB-linked outer membrane protein [Olivibacter]|uniref:SusC/RagA family TonB-linked outer membrane protein n=1 Tax=Olivibacter jilunii TaxID=985016 RepID=A0ABW6AWP7_9SPHI|nr:TonB-dependent receptor [Olivibacter sp. UJ_SKK_5.1]MDX3911890.1 TonB-dependent receptor [Pseudosphingobacterium sp.]